MIENVLFLIDVGVPWAFALGIPLFIAIYLIWDNIQFHRKKKIRSRLYEKDNSGTSR